MASKNEVRIMEQEFSVGNDGPLLAVSRASKMTEQKK